MIIFSPRLENYQFSQPRYIFLIHGKTIYIFSMSLKKHEADDSGLWWIIFHTIKNLENQKLGSLTLIRINLVSVRFPNLAPIFQFGSNYFYLEKEMVTTFFIPEQTLNMDIYHFNHRPYTVPTRS